MANRPTDNELTSLARRFLWVDDPSKVNVAIRCLAILCALLFVLDFVIHRHSYFSIEGWPGFYVVTGFVAFTVIVISAKNLRRLILRDENFYGHRAVDSEEYPRESRAPDSVSDSTSDQRPDS